MDEANKSRSLDLALNRDADQLRSADSFGAVSRKPFDGISPEKNDRNCGNLGRCRNYEC